MEDYDEDAYKAYVSKRRKKRLQLRIELLKPTYVVDFENTTGTLFDLNSLFFTPSVVILNGPVSGQIGEQPGALALKEFSDKVKLGFWSVLPFEISRLEPFQLKSLDIVSGNYNNFTLDLKGFDANNNVISTHTFTTSPGDPKTILPEFPAVYKFTLTRNTGSVEVRHPNAVGTILTIGGRPRPPVYTKSIFLASITYK